MAGRVRCDARSKPAGEVLRTCGVTPQVRSTSPAGLPGRPRFSPMNATVFSAILVIGIGQDLRDRERHPLAPSLPLLTKEESAKIDAVIERFIQYDIGKLKGAEGKKAFDDFNRLGAESFFNLVDGLNRAAEMEDSCPAVIIGKRVASIIRTTDDPHLLAFAKDSIGAGVAAKRHRGTLQDLQAAVLFRKAALQRRGITIASTKVMLRKELEGPSPRKAARNSSQLCSGNQAIS